MTRRDEYDEYGVYIPSPEEERRKLIFGVADQIEGCIQTKTTLIATIKVLVSSGEVIDATINLYERDKLIVGCLEFPEAAQLTYTEDGINDETWREETEDEQLVIYNEAHTHLDIMYRNHESNAECGYFFDGEIGTSRNIYAWINTRIGMRVFCIIFETDATVEEFPLISTLMEIVRESKWENEYDPQSFSYKNFTVNTYIKLNPFMPSFNEIPLYF
jgi:hypothetical protein